MYEYEIMTNVEGNFLSTPEQRTFEAANEQEAETKAKALADSLSIHFAGISSEDYDAFDR